MNLTKQALRAFQQFSTLRLTPSLVSTALRAFGPRLSARASAHTKADWLKC
jgi:hypothetical protein